MQYLKALAAGNFHEPDGLRAMKVGDVDRSFFHRIRRDVEELVMDRPCSEVAVGHVTNWTNPIGRVRQWSLFNRHGRTDDTSDDFSYRLGGKRVPRGFDAIAEFAAGLPDLVNLRLNVMDPGAALSPHEEHLPRKIGANQVGLRARFHLPTVTNPAATMMADGDVFHFEAGTVYVFNNGCVHSAENDGIAPRMHLVWDQLMTERAYTKAFVNPEPLEPVGTVEIGEYATQGGMSESEFRRRELVWMPR